MSRRPRARGAQLVIKDWQSDDVFPFTEPPHDRIDEVKRALFNVVAFTAAERVWPTDTSPPRKGRAAALVGTVTGRYSSVFGRVAGAFALASGFAYVAYLIPPEGRDQAITAWNLLIIPTALYLGGRLASRGPIISASSTAAGVTASLLWAFGYRSPSLEPWWIGLAAAWWLGLGWLLRNERRAARAVHAPPRRGDVDRLRPDRAGCAVADLRARRLQGSADDRLDLLGRPCTRARSTVGRTAPPGRRPGSLVRCHGPGRWAGVGSSGRAKPQPRRR